MKAILICPGYRPAVAQLVESAPLAAVPLLGESLLAYWLVHLAAQGAREVTVLACDRPGAIRQLVGTGARWGLRARVVAEMRELTPEEVRARRAPDEEGYLPAPLDVVLIDHLPGGPEHRLAESYAGWFAAVQAGMDHATTPDRVGVREVQPGVRVGWRSHVPADAVLVPPCWIGEKVTIGSGVTLGPNAVVEDRAVIGRGAEVARSIVGAETMVGVLTEVADSLALGDTLVNWQDGSCLHVADEFLLCPLRRQPADYTEWFRRVAQALTGSTPPLVPVDHASQPHS